MRKSIITFMVLMPVWCVWAATVAPEQIAGVKRVNQDTDCIELAWSGPKKLFADEAVVAVKNGRFVISSPAQMIAEFKAVRPNLSFSCAVKAASGAAATNVKLIIKDDAGKTVGEKTVAVKPGEWSVAVFPSVGNDGKAVSYKLEAAAETKTELESVSLFRSFSQYFELDTAAPLTGIYFHKFGASDQVSDGLTPGSYFDGSKQRWNMPAAGIQDGIAVGVLDKDYYPLLGVSKKGAKGLPLPVPTRNGCFVSYMVFSAPILSFQPEKNGYKNSETGKSKQWNMDSVELPIGDLDSNADGFWQGNPGQTWTSANTLVQSLGGGKIAYIAFINQNRINVPVGAKNFKFAYRAKNNPSAVFQTVIPEKTRSVGIVKRKDGGTQLVWNIDGVWTGGSVIRDSADPDCLMIRNNSIVIE